MDYFDSAYFDASYFDTAEQEPASQPSRGLRSDWFVMPPQPVPQPAPVSEDAEFVLLM